MAEQIIPKRCCKCKETKPISEFHKNKHCTKDGHVNDCKVCAYKKIRKYILTEKGKIVNREAKRRYKKSKKGKATQYRYQQTEKIKVARRRYKQSVKGKTNYKQYYSCHPERCRARIAIKQAITAGKLSRPDTRLCHYCPKLAQQYHHWHGYEPEHKLDVVPVCIKCHGLESRKAS